MSSLFKVFHLTFQYGASSGLDPGNLKLYLEAKEEFLALIPPGLAGGEFVRSAYEIFDRLAGENTAHLPIVCKAGCSVCCYQMVCSTETEMRLIIDYLRNLKTREKRLALREAVKRARTYRNFIPSLAQMGFNTRVMGWDDPIRRALYKRPCIFLRHNKCAIYPVRPPDCRCTRVLEKVCEPEREKPRLIKFFLDQVLADVLTEEDMRIKKLEKDPQIAPMFGWIISEALQDVFL